VSQAMLITSPMLEIGIGVRNWRARRKVVDDLIKWLRKRDRELQVVTGQLPPFSKFGEAADRITELEAQVESLQSKIHLCAGYDALEKRCAELEAELKPYRTISEQIKRDLNLPAPPTPEK